MQTKIRSKKRKKRIDKGQENPKDKKQKLKRDVNEIFGACEWQK